MRLPGTVWIVLSNKRIRYVMLCHHPRRRQLPGVRFHLRLSVCLSVFRTISQKPTQLGSPKLDAEMFYHESWKPIHFGVKMSKVKVTKTLPALVCALLCFRDNVNIISAFIIISGQRILTKGRIAVLSPLAVSNRFVRPWPPYTVWGQGRTATRIKISRLLSRYPWPARISPQTASRSVQSFLHGLRTSPAEKQTNRQTDRQTDRPRCVAIGCYR